MLKHFLLLAFFFPVFLANGQQAQEGMASVIQDAFDKQETRYGVRYDKRELTCAHNLHPFGSLLKVTNLENKRSVTVRVIDEGPFTKGRIIDLSRRAAEIIGIKTDLETLVRVELVRTPSPPAKNSTSNAEKPSPLTTSVAPAKAEPAKTVQPTAVPVATKQPIEKLQAKSVRIDPGENGLFQITKRVTDPQSWGVQIGSISNAEYVFSEIERLQSKNFDNILLSLEKGDAGQIQYKLILGPFYSEEQARQYLANLKSRHKINGFVVNLHRSGN